MPRVSLLIVVCSDVDAHLVAEDVLARRELSCARRRRGLARHVAVLLVQVGFTAAQSGDSGREREETNDDEVRP